MQRQGRRILIGRNGRGGLRRYLVRERQTFKSLLDDSSSILGLATRRLFTEDGQEVTSIDQVVNGGVYIAAGREAFRPLPSSSDRGDMTAPRSITHQSIAVSTSPCTSTNATDAPDVTNFTTITTATATTTNAAAADVASSSSLAPSSRTRRRLPIGVRTARSSSAARKGLEEKLLRQQSTELKNGRRLGSSSDDISSGVGGGSANGGRRRRRRKGLGDGGGGGNNVVELGSSVNDSRRVSLPSFSSSSSPSSTARGDGSTVLPKKRGGRLGGEEGGRGPRHLASESADESALAASMSVLEAWVPATDSTTIAEAELDLPGTPLDGEVAVVARVCVIYTGGTIGMRQSPDGFVPTKTFLDKHLRTVSLLHDSDFPRHNLPGPGLITPLSRLGRRVYYEIFEFEEPLDSVNLDMSDWIHIAKVIRDRYEDWDGFVVLHGTDTMAYTASALSFLLENLGKPVVLTGSQVSVSVTPNDGISNIEGALTLAGHFVIPEVTLFFDNHLYRGNRSCKDSVDSYKGFTSLNYPPLATVGSHICVKWDLVMRPVVVGRFRIADRLEPNVAVLRLFPGITVATIRSLAAPPTKGIVLMSYGAGNAPERIDFLAELEAATNRGVVIINCTQCRHGSVVADYRSGKKLRNAGVLGGGDITPECALAKLAYVLGKNLPPVEARALMERNLVGEVTVASADADPTRISLQLGSFATAVAETMNATSAREGRHIRDALAPVLLCAAAHGGDVLRVTELLSEGYDPNLPDYDERTPLHQAASSGHEDVVRLLLEVGAKVHVRDRTGRSPLQNAVAGGHSRVVTLLADAGALLLLSPLEEAAQLCQAAATNASQTLRLLLTAGADSNARDFEGRTALHAAVARGGVETLKLLLSTPGIDPNPRDMSGRTPLEMAMTLGRSEIVPVLMSFIAQKAGASAAASASTTGTATA